MPKSHQRRILGWARRKERLSRSKLKQAFLFVSDAELFMHLIQCNRFGSWNVRALVANLRSPSQNLWRKTVSNSDLKYVLVRDRVSWLSISLDLNLQTIYPWQYLQGISWEGHRVGIWHFSKICRQIPCPRANHPSQLQPNFPTPGCTLLSIPRLDPRKAQ